MNLKCVERLELEPILKGLVYKAIEENRLQKLKKDILSFCSLYTGIDVISINSRNKNYWMLRGWSELDSIYKSNLKNNSYKREKSSSPFCIEYWLKRGYSESDSLFESRSCIPINKEYWLKRGYSESDSIELSKQKKQKNNILGANSLKSSLEYRVNSHRCIEYWIVRGYSEQDAIIKIKKLQSTFSLKRCIEKYGIYEGTEKFNNRTIKWKEKILNKG